MVNLNYILVHPYTLCVKLFVLHLFSYFSGKMAKKPSTTNERELTAKLSEWFNEVINRNRFPFKEATSEAPAKFDSKTYFGDLLLWVNRAAQQVYSYIEIK